MPPVVRRVAGILFVVACIAAALFVVTRSANPTAGVGAAIGVVVVMLLGNRARRR